MKYRVALRLDGGHQAGLGNIIRCVALADAVRNQADADFLFVMAADPIGVPDVESRGFAVAPVRHNDVNEAVAALERYRPHLIFNDILYPSPAYMAAIKGLAPVVNYDGIGNSYADVVIDATLKPTCEGLGAAVYRSGPEYLLLRDVFFKLRGEGYARDTARPPQRLLILMGGSDPSDLTILAVEALRNVGAMLETVVVTGSGYRSHERLRVSASSSKHDITVRANVEAGELLLLMQKADIGVVKCGTSAYEMACVGLPFIAIAHNEEEHRLGRVGEFDFCTYLGLGSLVKTKSIGLAIDALVGDPQLRARLAANGMNTVDAKGSFRVAQLLLDLIQGRLPRAS